MLSGETAKGVYPTAAGAFFTFSRSRALTDVLSPFPVEMMAETCYLAESAICYPPLFNELRALVSRPTSTSETVAISAVAAALEQNAGAILVMSTSGNTARLVSKYRPPCPVITSASLFRLPSQEWS